jgi:peptidoglycan hydrolase-like protein with peptidoglycan-binding domain
VPRLRFIVGSVLVALTLAPAAGAFNPQIAGLQIALRERGIYRGAIDGVQGPRTKTAVRTFQRRNGLAVDGLAGQRTRRALGALGRPLFGTRVLRRGSIGYDVSVLQFLLRRHGYRPGRLDGRLGARTARAVRRFQRRNRIAADGVVGPATAKRLCAARACAWRGPSVRARARPRVRRVHRVRRGETLTTISQRYGLSLQTISRANRLNPQGILFAGARLHIPKAPRIEAARAAVRGPWSVRAALDYWSRHYGVDSELVRALAWFESGFANHLTSSAGAMGVMQVTPATWSYVETILVGRKIPRTMSGNVRVGVVFLRQLLREFDGNVELALAAYAQGPTSIRTRGVLKETRLYVAGVLALKKKV